MCQWGRPQFGKKWEKLAKKEVNQGTKREENWK